MTIEQATQELLAKKTTFDSYNYFLNYLAFVGIPYYSQKILGFEYPTDSEIDISSYPFELSLLQKREQLRIMARELCKKLAVSDEQSEESSAKSTNLNN